MNNPHITKLFDDLCYMHSKVAYEELHDEEERLKVSLIFGALVSYLTTQMNKSPYQASVDLEGNISVESL